MRKLLILQLGNTHPFIAAQQGDFVDWFISGLQVDPARLMVIDPRQGEEFPPYDQVFGIVMTGSHAMVTDHLPWSERTAAWLPGAVERDIPTLGICYGHQLLAYAMGGKVGDNPKGWDYGTAAVRLNERGQADHLLGGIGSVIKAQVGHIQTVLQLPAGAELLASSDRDNNQAFVLNGCAWGLQFHPEMKVDTIQQYIEYGRSALIKQSQDPDQLIAACEDTPIAAGLLARFAYIAMDHH